MDYYKIKEPRLSELLNVVQACLLGSVTLEECTADIDELEAMGHDFKDRRDDKELRLLGVKLVQFTAEFKRDKVKQKRLVRSATAMRKAIERLERRLKNV